MGIGERYQEETKYTPGRMGYALDWQNMPEPHKNYASPIATIALPEPLIGQAANVWEVFGRRRSTRAFSPAQNLPLDLLSCLLWSTQGITATAGEWVSGRPLGRSALPHRDVPPCTSRRGARTRYIPFQASCVRPGAYQERRIRHAAGRCRPWTGHDPAGSGNVGGPGRARVARSTWKYRQRAYRYIYMDAGHIGQNLYLAGTAARLGVCTAGAFFDDQVNDLIGIDGTEETTVYLASVGWPKT